MLKIISKGNFESIQEFTVLENQKLGSGSFGTVKLAIHNSTNRMYALKIVFNIQSIDQFGQFTL